MQQMDKTREKFKGNMSMELSSTTDFNLSEHGPYTPPSPLLFFLVLPSCSFLLHLCKYLLKVLVILTLGRCMSMSYCYAGSQDKVSQV